MRLTALHVGSRRHGVTRHGWEAAQGLAALGVGVRHLHRRPGQPVAVVGPLLTAFSDSLWAASTAAAADRFLQAIAPAGGPVVVVLHDLPDPADDPARLARRQAAYARVAAAADHVVVQSRVEADRLARSTPTSATPVSVVPNPVPAVEQPAVERPAPVRSPRRGEGADGLPAIGLLGWVFPDKGYPAVIESLAGLPVRITALGAPSPGHGGHVAALRRRAAAVGLRLDVTGWLPDRALADAMAQVDLAIAPHPAPSASGSMLTWLAAGRRPLVRRSPFAAELAARVPGSITTYDPADLAAAATDALRSGAGRARQPVPAEVHPRVAAERLLAVLAHATGRTALEQAS